LGCFGLYLPKKNFATNFIKMKNFKKLIENFLPIENLVSSNKNKDSIFENNFKGKLSL